MNKPKLLRLDEGRTFCLNLEVAVPEKKQCFGDPRPKRYTEEEILTYVSDQWIERVLYDTLDNRSIDSIFVYGKKIVKSTKLGIFITPMKAASIFMKLLLSVEVEVTISYSTVDKNWNPSLYISCEDLEFSFRTSTVLQKHNIQYVWELAEKTEFDLLRLEHFGRKSLNEVKEILQEQGLRLAMNLKGFNPNKKEMER